MLSKVSLVPGDPAEVSWVTDDLQLPKDTQISGDAVSQQELGAALQGVAQ